MRQEILKLIAWKEDTDDQIEKIAGAFSCFTFFSRFGDVPFSAR